MDCVAHNGTHRRHPWMAAGLSLVLPGLGHVYAGRIAAGLGLACLFGLSIPALAALISRASPAPPALLLSSFFFLGVVVALSAAHAAVVARREVAPYHPRDYNRWYVYALLIVIGTGSSFGYALVAKNRFLEAFVVPTASMSPTIVPSDRVLANKAAYKSSDVRRGDIIVYASVDDPRRLHLDRVIALGGDTVEMREGVVFVNGRELAVEKADPRDTPWMTQADRDKVLIEHNGGAAYRILLSPEGASSCDYPLTTVTPHHCFVLGDNRTGARDSRACGPLPLVAVRGRVDYIHFPAHHWSRFGRIAAP